MDWHRRPLLKGMRLRFPLRFPWLRPVNASHRRRSLLAGVGVSSVPRLRKGNVDAGGRPDHPAPDRVYVRRTPWDEGPTVSRLF